LLAGLGGTQLGQAPLELGYVDPAGHGVLLQLLEQLLAVGITEAHASGQAAGRTLTAVP
jgi:hypothetical protein